MTVSFDLGHHKIFCAVLNKGSFIRGFTVPVLSVENGRIGNITEAAGELSKAFREENLRAGSCAFSLPSSAAFTKEMAIPGKLSRADKLSLIRTNFSAITDSGEDFAVDYLPLETSGEEVLLGLLLRRTLITQCQQLAKALKMRLTRVELHLCAIKMHRLRHAHRDRPEIVAYIDDSSAEITLFDSGHMFIRTAQLSEQSQPDSLLKNWAMSFNDTLSASDERETKLRILAEQIRNIMQFQLNRNGQRPVEQIFLYGQADGSMAEGVEAATIVETGVLANAGEIEYINAFESAVSKAKEPDFLEVIKRRGARTKRLIVQRAAMAAAFIVLVAAAVGAGALIQHQNTKLTTEIDSINAFLSDPKTAKQLEEARTVDGLLVAQREYNRTLDGFSKYFETVRRPKSSALEGIYRQAESLGVLVSYLDYNGGKLTMNCSAGSEQVAAEFSKALKTRGLAENVSFTGYAMEQLDQNTGYKFTLGADIGE